MKARIITAVVLVLLVTAGVIVVSSSRATQASSQERIAQLEAAEQMHRLSLKQRIELAKLKGQTKLLHKSSYANADYPDVAGFDAALNLFTVVLAQPVASAGYVNRAGEIGTSYKFKTLEVLSRPAAPQTPPTFSGIIHPDLQPLADDEFIVSMPGGKASIDGVEVTEKYDDLDSFDTTKRYLLFLTFDASGKIGGMSLGPMSALIVNDDHSVSTLDKKDNTLKRGMDAEYGNSVERLKTHLRKKVKN